MNAIRWIRGEIGVSLAEMLVTIVVAGIIGATAVLGVTTLMRYQRSIETRDQAQQQAQLAVDQIASQVRSGNVLHQPTKTTVGATVTNWSLLLYTQANGDQKCVEWDLAASSKVLSSRSWVPDWNSNGRADAGEVTDWRTVASNVVNGSLTPQIDPFRVPTEAPFYERLLIIELRAGVDDNQPTGLPVSTSVTGRNTQYNYDTDLCGDKPS